MIWGTAYFVSRKAAFAYYARQGDDKDTVLRRLEEGLIHVGIPHTVEGEKLIRNQVEGRFFIDDGKP